MSETLCAVCHKGKGPKKCEVCGFSDDGFINRDFINKEDADYWFDTVVKPYRVQWEAGKREAELLAQIDELKAQLKKEQETNLLPQIDEFKTELVESNKKAKGSEKKIQTSSSRHSSSQPVKGGIIKFGSYDWRVLDVQNDKALIITENVIEEREYNEELVDVTWEDCTLRKYLNGEFLGRFGKEEQRRIEETRIENKGNHWYGTEGGKDTSDQIFLLSLEEADRYFGDSRDYQSKRRKDYDQVNGKYVADNDGLAFSNANDSDRVAKLDKKACCWWWLRSPGSYSYNAAIVFADGDVYVFGLDVRDSGGVRPALWLNL